MRTHPWAQTAFSDYSFVLTNTILCCGVQASLPLKTTDDHVHERQCVTRKLIRLHHKVNPFTGLWLSIRSLTSVQFIITLRSRLRAKIEALKLMPLP